MQSWSAITRLTRRVPSKSISLLESGLRVRALSSRPEFSRYFQATASRKMSTQAKPVVNGDLNNTEVLRKTVALPPDPAYLKTSSALPANEDDESIRSTLRPFLLPEDVTANDWISKLELSTALKMSEADFERTGGDRLKVMVLYGSLRSRYISPQSSRQRYPVANDLEAHIPASCPSNAHVSFSV